MTWDLMIAPNLSDPWMISPKWEETGKSDAQEGIMKRDGKGIGRSAHSIPHIIHSHLLERPVAQSY
jgi:hypothetical protein